MSDEIDMSDLGGQAREQAEALTNESNSGLKITKPFTPESDKETSLDERFSLSTNEEGELEYVENGKPAGAVGHVERLVQTDRWEIEEEWKWTPIWDLRDTETGELARMTLTRVREDGELEWVVDHVETLEEGDAEVPNDESASGGEDADDGTYVCSDCGKAFESAQALGGHATAACGEGSEADGDSAV